MAFGPFNRVVITGGAGFVGSHLVEHLLDKRREVVVIDDFSSGSLANLPVGHPRLTIVEHRVDDEFAELCAGADLIAHLAGPIGVRETCTFPYDVCSAILQAGMLVADFAAQTRTPVLYTSSSEVYGDGRQHELMTEDGAARILPGVRWNYAAAKLAIEHLLMSVWRQQGVPTWIIRFFNLVGARQNFLNGSVLPSLCRAALNNEPLLVHDDGQQRRAFLHVRDAVSALMHVMSTPALIGRPLNIGGELSCTVLELAELIRETLGSVSPIKLVPLSSVAPGASQVIDRRPNLTQIRDTGWRPTHTLQDAILDCAEAVRSTPGVPQDVAAFGG